mmetsp:Transcript_15474/g.43494  ORF Transcript_15474/g.43494 Transcript_15474/m.43494 type:complete len:200 (-) Transcript_15474:983-1582(-)
MSSSDGCCAHHCACSASSSSSRPSPWSRCSARMTLTDPLKVVTDWRISRDFQTAVRAIRRSARQSGCPSTSMAATRIRRPFRHPVQFRPSKPSHRRHHRRCHQCRHRRFRHRHIHRIGPRCGPSPAIRPCQPRRWNRHSQKRSTRRSCPPSPIRTRPASNQAKPRRCVRRPPPCHQRPPSRSTWSPNSSRRHRPCRKPC